MTSLGGAWEVLRADPLHWLLDERQPNLLWRVLVELIGRPRESPAVRRAQGGASAAEPVASLLERLAPDGTWMSRARLWTAYSGTGWRLVAAVGWGADPDDPRLAAAAERLLAMAPGEGGFAARVGEPPSPPITGRALEALSRIGWLGQQRCQEALAWLEERGELDRVTATAVLSALVEGGELRRKRLLHRATTALLEDLARPRRGLRFGHPNLLRTDPLEELRALVLAGVPFEVRMAPLLRRIQALQDWQGRWPLEVAPPRSLPFGGEARPTPGKPSPWVTLAALVVLLRFGAAAGLPRLFPERAQG